MLKLDKGQIPRIVSFCSVGETEGGNKVMEVREWKVREGQNRKGK